MQDPNTENSIQDNEGRGYDETVPTRVPVDDEKTIPVKPQAASGEAGPGYEPTQPVAAAPSGGETNYAVGDVPVLHRAGGVPPEKPAKKAFRLRQWHVIVLGVLLVILFAGIGVWLGYRSAVNLRQTLWEERRVTTATEHFMLGLAAQENKQYEIARTHFEYVIQLDPNFPGAADKLVEVMAASLVKNTPTPAPTVELPTPTPTPDTRPLEEIFNTAKQLLVEKKWDDLIATIDTLRTIDPTYRAVEVDGMLYMALRFRGVEKIIYSANLEGGIYDLALAERFGPLDQDAIGYRNWARMYLNGASFWEVDWVKVMNYFEQIYPAMSNMRDSSGMTAIDRYRIAAREQARKLAAQEDYCGSLEYYEKSLGVVMDNELAVEATAMYDKCHPPEPTETPTSEVTLTPEVTPTVSQEPAPTEPPAEEPTEPAAEPTAPAEETSEPIEETVEPPPSGESTEPPAEG